MNISDARWKLNSFKKLGFPKHSTVLTLTFNKGLPIISKKNIFSKHQPSGPMLSISWFVRLSVCVSVRLFTFEVPFEHLFVPTSRSRMSTIFRSDLNIFVCKLSKIAAQYFFVFFCWFCRTKHVENNASRWMRDLWSKGISLILAYL